ncbi:MAG: hypothetical protein V4622_01790 [Bacteroidota bacterium]
MKKTYLLLLLASFSIISCGVNDSQVKKDKEKLKKDLKGEWKKRTYINHFFDLNINLNEYWEIDEMEHFSTLGATLIDASSFLNGDSINASAVINLSFKMANPFDREASVEKELNESRDGFKMIYEANEIDIMDFEPKKLGKKDFILSRIRLRDSGDTTFVDEYMLKQDKFFLSLVLSYSSKEGFSVCNHILDQIK